MAENTAIEWTQHTWNPWQGCHKVSLGCAKCYMFRDKERFGQNPNIVQRSSDKTFYAPLKWKELALVFTCSWSDFFIEEADEWRDEAFEVIRQTSHLTYQILTKRPERINPCFKFPPNVWIGVSVENQKQANERIPYLFNIQAETKFVSFEPLLERIQLELVPDCTYTFYADVDDDSSKEWDYELPFSWAIIGGESDYRHPRPMKQEWAQEIVDVCEQCEIPVFFKQMGGTKKIYGHWGGNILFGKTYQEFPK